MTREDRALRLRKLFTAEEVERIEAADQLSRETYDAMEDQIAKLQDTHAATRGDEREG